MKKPEILHDLFRRRTLFVSDLDGTLLTPASVVSSESAEMLNEAIARGAMFTIATARTPATVVNLMKEIDMALPAVVMTGAAQFDIKSKTFSELQLIPREVADTLIDLYRKHDVATFIYTFTGKMLEVFHIGELNELERGFISERAHTSLKRFSIPPSGESALPAVIDNCVLLYSVQPWEKASALYEEIKRLRINVNPLCYHENFGNDWAQLEMFSPTASKAHAVENIASKVRADRIVAFGDNVNDLPLFEIADEGVAVGNAIDALKERASIVIGSNDEPSVASFILNSI